MKGSVLNALVGYVPGPKDTPYEGGRCALPQSCIILHITCTASMDASRRALSLHEYHAPSIVCLLHVCSVCRYKIDIDLDPQYPFVPPRMRFLTPVCYTFLQPLCWKCVQAMQTHRRPAMSCVLKWCVRIHPSCRSGTPTLAVQTGRFAWMC